MTDTAEETLGVIPPFIPLPVVFVVAFIFSSIRGWMEWPRSIRPCLALQAWSFLLTRERLLLSLLLAKCCYNMAKGKDKAPPGCLLAESVTQVTRFSMPLGARLWHYAAELRTLSVTYPLCGSALTDTTDNPLMCPLKLTDFCLFVYHPSYKILQGLLIPPMAFTSHHDQGSNRLPQDGRASTLTTKPLRLA